MSSRQAKRALPTNSRRWRAIRAQVLMEQPLCPLCEAQGKTVAAVDVDHRDNNPHNNARQNLWGLCRRHHSEKTATEQAGRDWQAKGCDASGWPLARSGEG